MSHQLNPDFISICFVFCLPIRASLLGLVQHGSAFWRSSSSSSMTTTLPRDDGAEDCGDPLGDSLGIELEVMGIETEDPTCWASIASFFSSLALVLFLRTVFSISGSNCSCSLETVPRINKVQKDYTKWLATKRIMNDICVCICTKKNFVQNWLKWQNCFNTYDIISLLPGSGAILM